jgi:hypothetical protein
LSATDSRNVVIEHDANAEGPLVEWALATMRADLRALLREAGADTLADALDDAVVASALDTVTQTARYVTAAGRPVRVD